MPDDGALTKSKHAAFYESKIVVFDSNFRFSQFKQIYFSKNNPRYKSGKIRKWQL
jgi:hypothetical protein